jgi:hypothetical protein
MLRYALPTLAALLLAGSAYAAQAPDSAASVLHDCSGQNLAPDQVDTCLERTRMLDESNPDPALRSLEVKLSQMEAKQPPRALSQSAAPPPPQDEVEEVAPPDTPPPNQVKSLDPGQADAHVDESGRDTSDDDIDPNEGPPTDADMHPYNRDAPSGGRN